MEPDYKSLAAAISSVIERLSTVDLTSFLKFVQKNYPDDAASSIARFANCSRSEKKKARSKIQQNSDSETWGIYRREIQAILSDTSFLPGRGDVLRILEIVLNCEIPKSIEKKGSRDAVIQWGIRKLGEQPLDSRQAAYRVIRQAFLRRRDSSLGDWADILSKSPR